MQKHSIFLLLAVVLLLDVAAGCNAPGQYKFTTIHIVNYLPGLRAHCQSTYRSIDRTQEIAPNREMSFRFCPHVNTRIICELSTESLYRRFPVFDGHDGDKSVSQHYWIAKGDGIFYYNNVDTQVVQRLDWDSPPALD